MRLVMRVPVRGRRKCAYINGVVREYLQLQTPHQYPVFCMCWPYALWFLKERQPGA